MLNLRIHLFYTILTRQWKIQKKNIKLEFVPQMVKERSSLQCLLQVVIMNKVCEFAATSNQRDTYSPFQGYIWPSQGYN